VSSPAAGSPLLLVVDDEPSNVEVLCDLLQALDYRTVGAGSGEAALAAARERRPDLVLLDVMMPGLSGFDVLRELKAYEPTSTIPIIMLTGVSEKSKIQEAIMSGTDFYIVKPFEFHDLLTKVVEALEGAM
jgi:two-component system sensor histidine kinase ChiS